jgi:hypothetical protein
MLFPNLELNSVIVAGRRQDQGHALISFAIVTICTEVWNIFHYEAAGSENGHSQYYSTAPPAQNSPLGCYTGQSWRNGVRIRYRNRWSSHELGEVFHIDASAMNILC